MKKPIVYRKLFQQILFWAFLGAFHLSGMAQGLTITGKILSVEKNEPLVGVSVLLKGTQKGTVTNDKGEYQLIVPDTKATLVMSLVGYTPQQIIVGNKNVINISMAEDVQSLAEIVVTGYGTQKKSDFLGAAASLKAAAIKEIPITTMEQAMQGRMTGVQVQQSSGQPGAGVSVRVRGATSIAGGNEPLFVIDGVPQFNGDTRGLNALSLINSSDIESIEVLKDASATAIYGSRGANGVVMITTKGTRMGQPSRITYDNSYTFQTVRKKLDLMTGDELLAFNKQWFTNSNRAIPAELTNATNANTDWQSEMFRTALQQSHNLSFSGGSEKTQYYVSGSYLSQPGIVKGTDFTRGTIRFNLNTKFSDHISIRTYMTASSASQIGASASDGTPSRNFGKSAVGSTVLTSPTVPVKNPDGTWGNPRPFTFSGIDVENPVAFVTDALDKTVLSRFQGGLDLSVIIAKGLTNTTRFGTDYSYRRNDLYFPITLAQVGSGVGIGQLNFSNTLNLLGENYLEYKTKISNDIAFEGILGASVQTSSTDLTGLQGTKYISDDLKDYNFSAAGSVTKPVTDIVNNNIVSTFGRVRFTIKDRYMFSASIRQDGASVFSKNKKYGTFPSVGAAWRISEEKFMKQQSLISNLKLKASWGQAGNPAIQPYQSLLIGNVVNTAQGAGAGIAVGLSPTLPNDNLSWETTTQSNVGLDLSLLNDRFRFNADYYVKTTSSLLATVQLPPSSGYSTIIDNVGEVQNSGLELELGADLINTQDFRWTVDANISFNKNVVTKTKDNRDLLVGSSIIRVGQPLSAFFGPKFTRFDENGRQSFEDLNGDKVINAADNQVLGSPYPATFFGISSTWKYKQFTLGTTWTGVSGSKIYNLGLTLLTSPLPDFNKVRNIAEYYPKVSALDVARLSDLYIEDGSYIRMRNIRLDYKLPIKNGKFLKSANIYVSGQNLLTFTKYSAFDPEVNTYSGNDVRQGYDVGAYPAIKSYTLGLSVSF